jgi:hypothetical protein
MPIIEFYCDYIDNAIQPSPSKNFMPDWYKKENSSLMLKRCMPFIDGFMSGYIAVTTKDIVVNQDSGIPFIKNSDIVGERDSSSIGEMPTPIGCNQKQFLWNSPYIIKTPQNYSIFICHPVNRYDLPFTTLSAIVDSDSIMPKGNIPFFIKEGFSGLVPSGTPIFQFTPFLREEWSSFVNKDLIEESEKRNNNFKEDNFYKKKYWKNKKYE